MKISSKIAATLVRCLNFIQLCSVFRKLASLQAFFYIDLNVIWIIEVHNFQTKKQISIIKELIQDISKVDPLFKFHSLRFTISEVRVLQTVTAPLLKFNHHANFILNLSRTSKFCKRQNDLFWQSSTEIYIFELKSALKMQMEAK